MFFQGSFSIAMTPPGKQEKEVKTIFNSNLKFNVWQSVRSEARVNSTDCTLRLRLRTRYCSYCLLLFPHSSGYSPPPFYPVTFGRCTPAVGMERQQERRAGRRQCFTPRSKLGGPNHGSHTSPPGAPNPPPGLHTPQMRQVEGSCPKPHLPTSEHHQPSPAACPKNHTCPPPSSRILSKFKPFKEARLKKQDNV